MKKLIISMLSVIAVAAAGSVYAGSNEGVRCIKKGSTVQAVYDKGSNGRTVRRNIRVGSSYKGGQCMGRCGAACGGWLPSAWTKDCLDHDICIVDQNGQNGGAGDTNCGDEFRQAADDYITGVIRGCRG
ncbi:MAG: hypothetical protein MK188_13000 [Gammaproteobacteria bacterium]|nr:hypothetical protein [Gammaproteobacteria bacterium]